jgi:hypothetical protein
MLLDRKIPHCEAIDFSDCFNMKCVLGRMLWQPISPRRGTFKLLARFRSTRAEERFVKSGTQIKAAEHYRARNMVRDFKIIAQSFRVPSQQLDGGSHQLATDRDPDGKRRNNCSMLQ